MKKVLSVALALLICFCCSLSFSASSDLTSLKQVQSYCLRTAPDDMMSLTVELSGTIESIQFLRSNHYIMVIRVDEEGAASPIAGDPCFIAHFRVHNPYIEYEPGQEVSITGTLNSLYCSPVIPFVMVNTINGSEDF